MEALTTAPIPADGIDMTVHSEQERGNRALTHMILVIPPR
jgi:hypothetical protein